MVKDWKIVRAVVELRTNVDLSEKQLAQAVDSAKAKIEQSLERRGHNVNDAHHSNLKVKAFKRTVGALNRWGT